MTIGDKVKLRNTNETGVITNVLKGDMIEVALDGWNSKQLFSKNELTLISKPSVSQSIDIGIAGKVYEKGIFLAFVPQKLPTGESLILNLINNSNSDFAFTISTDKNDKSTGVMAGFLKAKSFQSANKDFFISNFDEWKTLTFSALFYSTTPTEYQLPFVKQLKLHAGTFFQSKKEAPFLDKEAYLFQIDGRPLEINAKEIAEKMFETNVGPNTEQILKPASEVDLHIENISKTYWRLSNAEIFALQLKTFENHLEQSIASGLDNVVFIHGIGDGKLKSAIHQILAGHRNISFFGKASEQKYGDGATLVRIK